LPVMYGIKPDWTKKAIFFELDYLNPISHVNFYQLKNAWIFLGVYPTFVTFNGFTDRGSDHIILLALNKYHAVDIRSFSKALIDKKLEWIKQDT
jgi:hypothetical protein